MGKKYTYVLKKNPNPENEEDKFYCLLSTLKGQAEICHAYPLRWKIECCFKHLKTGGFDLEAINFDKPSKVKLMMAILAFLYTLCVSYGLIKVQKGKRSSWKRYQDDTKYLAVSIFRIGLSYLKGAFCNLTEFLSFIQNKGRRKKFPKWLYVQ